MVRSISRTSFSLFQGLVQKSVAPSLIADTAVSIEP